MESEISKRVSRYTSQEVCPWNEKFSLPLREIAFRPRRAVAGKDAATLARELLAMSDEEFRVAFKGSPMKRAKLRGLRRNSAVVLGNLGSEDAFPALVSALSDTDPLVRAHAAWALGRIASDEAADALQDRLAFEDDGVVSKAIGAALASLAAES